MRKAYLDNLRICTVLSVVVYHAAYLFNGQGIPVGITAGHGIALFDLFALSVYPWFMVLLFIIAGMSARFSLEKRTMKEFIKERTRKLLVPSTLGLFAFHIWTGYYNMRNAGADFSAIPAPLKPIVMALSGTGVLWFVQMLWLFSVLLLPLLRRITYLEELGRRSGYAALFMFSILIYASAQVLNAPVIIVYRFGIYAVSFLLGYYAFSDEGVMERVDKARFAFLFLAVLSYALYLIRFRGTDYTASACLKDISTNLYAYFMSSALLGIFRHYADRSNDLLDHLRKDEFGIYVFHYTPMVTAAYYLVRADLPYILNYLIVIASGILGSIALFEAVRRIPVYRYAVLGIRGKGSFHKNSN